MKDNLLSGLLGYATSTASVIAGLITVRSMLEAFLIGAMGALGGLVMKWAWHFFRTKLKRTNESK
jgi:hypothetical protein